MIVGLWWDLSLKLQTANYLYFHLVDGVRWLSGPFSWGFYPHDLIICKVPTSKSHEHWRGTSIQSRRDFLSFHSMSLSVPEFHAGYHITFSCHVSLGSSQLWELLGLVYGGMSLIAICRMLFSYTDWGSGLGRKVTRGKVLFSSHYIREHTLAVVYDYWWTRDDVAGLYLSGVASVV